ncbi:hypothetical protein EDB85DRAFT_1564812 [Lactarius pseudohatsudake]|nr:hypothetical protein EDB85DRAFT_1564812 [Lactarius pseudohatsudake]
MCKRCTNMRSDNTVTMRRPRSACTVSSHPSLLQYPPPSRIIVALISPPTRWRRWMAMATGMGTVTRAAMRTSTRTQTTGSGRGSTWYLYRLIRRTRWRRGSRRRRWSVLSVLRSPLAARHSRCRRCRECDKIKMSRLVPVVTLPRSKIIGANFYLFVLRNAISDKLRIPRENTN